MKPKVSVIVPVYNVEKYIHRCVDSIINQTLKDIEIILVDDKSPDKSPQICDEYARKDKRIKVVHKEKNEGLGLARNSGLEVAQGEFVAFVDSDDFIDKKLYETLYNKALKENLDAVYSEFNTKYYPGFNIIKKQEKTYFNKEDINNLMSDMIGAEPEYPSDVKFQVSSCKALYSLRIIQNNHIRFYSEREYLSEDLVYNLDFLIHCNKVGYFPIQLYYYCLNEASLSHTYKTNLWKRYLKMYHFLSGKRDLFLNKKDFELKLQRTLVFCTRGALYKEMFLNSNTEESKKNIRIILDTPELRRILNSYPGFKLPFKHRIFFFLTKYKMTRLIRILFNLQKRK